MSHGNKKSMNKLTNVSTRIVQDKLLNAELGRLNSALQQNQGNIEHWLKISEFYNEHSEHDLAISSFNDVKQSMRAGKFVLSPVVNLLASDRVYRGLSKAYALKTPAELNLAIDNLNCAINLTKNNLHLVTNNKVVLVQSYKELASLKLKAFQPAEAIEHLNESLTLLAGDEPNDWSQKTKINYYIELTDLHLNSQNNTDALSNLESALTACFWDKNKFSSQIVYVYYRLGKVNQQRENSDEALRCFEAGITEFKRTHCAIDLVYLARLHYECLMLCFKNKRYDETIMHSHHVLPLYTEQPVIQGIIYRILSHCSFNKAEKDMCLHYSKQALSIFEPLKEINSFEYAESCMTYLQAICIDANQFIDGIAYCDKAIIYYKKASKSNPLNKLFDERLITEKIATAHFSAGKIMVHNEQFDDAIRYFKVCLNHELYKDADNYFLYAYCNYRSNESLNNKQNNRIDIAIDAFFKGIKLYAADKNDINDLKIIIASTYLGRMYLIKKQFNNAKKQLNNALSMMKQVENPINIIMFNGVLPLSLVKQNIILDRHLDLATIAYEENNLSEAYEHYHVVLNDIIFQVPEHFKNYAACCVEIKKPLEAIDYYQRSLVNFPGHYSAAQGQKNGILYALGLLYFEQHELYHAANCFILALSPIIRLDVTQENKAIECLLLIADQYKTSDLIPSSPAPTVLLSHKIHQCLFNFYTQKELPKYTLAKKHFAEINQLTQQKVFVLNENASQTVEQYKNYALFCLIIKKPLLAIEYYKNALYLIGTLSILTEVRDTEEQKKELTYQLGKLYLDQDDLNNAKECFSSLIKKNDTEATTVSNKEPELFDDQESFAHVYLGETLARQNELDAAQRHYMIALNNPALQTAMLYYKVGCFFYDTKNDDRTEHYLNLVLSIDESCPNVNTMNNTHHEHIKIMLDDISRHRLELFYFNKYQKVVLPPEIKNIFEELANLYTSNGLTNVYLRGSAILTLLSGATFNKTQDLDFFAIGEPSNLLNENLKFNTCPFNANLYQRKTEDEIDVDCFVKPQTPDTEGSNALFLTDFTITSIYCDKEGMIYDPSRRGLHDFHTKILDLVDQQDPVSVLQADPCRLLRAIKYNMRDYELSSTLQQAIKHYIHHADPVVNEHLCATMRQMLGGDELKNQDLVARLSKEGLLEKLFGIADTESTKDMLLELKNKIKKKSPKHKNGQSSGFWQSSPVSEGGINSEPSRTLSPGAN